MFKFDRLESILSCHFYKKNIKTDLLEDFVNFVDTTSKQKYMF